MSGDGDEAIHEQVWRAVDDDGTTRAFLESIEPGDGLLIAVLGGTPGSADEATRLVLILPGRPVRSARFGVTYPCSSPKRCLITCCTSARNWQQRQGTIRRDIVGGVYKPDDLAERGLPSPDHGVVPEVSDDGLTAIFWRRTISGWHLG